MLNVVKELRIQIEEVMLSHLVCVGSLLRMVPQGLSERSAAFCSADSEAGSGIDLEEEVY